MLSKINYAKSRIELEMDLKKGGAFLCAVLGLFYIVWVFRGKAEGAVLL